MRRNEDARTRRAVEQIAQRAALSVEDLARGGADEGGTISAGGCHPDTGEWLAYGRLDFTLFGDGFRLAR